MENEGSSCLDMRLSDTDNRLSPSASTTSSTANLPLSNGGQGMGGVCFACWAAVASA